jgi:hypothetical protein
MKSYVSISNQISYAATTHEGVLGLRACVEAPVPMFWPPGLSIGSNKLTHTVFHQGLPICQAAHDLGWMLPHASVPPAVDDFKHLLASSRKHMFSSSRHRANGKSLSACGVINMAPTPCLACADPISIPMLGNITMAVSSRVTFGITNEDITAGSLEMTEAILVDLVGVVAKKTTTELGGWAVKTLAKNAKGLAVGAYKFIAEDGEAEISLDISLPWIGDLYGHTHGIRRDENGKITFFRKDRVAEHEVSAELSWDGGPRLDAGYDKLSEQDGGDVIVERDGKKYRYEGGDAEQLLESGGSLENWGRVTREDDE